MEMANVLAESGLTGVQWALNSRSARRTLRKTLQAMLAPGVTLGACRLVRAKYKPGRKLSAYYEVQLHSLGSSGVVLPHTGGVGLGHPALSESGLGSLALEEAGLGIPALDVRFFRQIEVRWTPVDGKPVEIGAEQAALQSEAEQRGLLFPFHSLVMSQPAWGVRIQVFPLDADFPQLPRLSDPAYVQTRLENLETDPMLGMPLSVTALRYRPGQRHVLRYDGGGTVFAKLYQRPERAEGTFQVARWASEFYAQAGEAPITSIRPLGYLPEDGVVFYPRAEGVTLSRLLRRPWQPDVGRALDLAGTSLRLLHQVPGLAGGPGVKIFADEIQAVLRISEPLRVLLPETQAQVERTLERLQAQYERLPQEEPSFAHSDFKADHLLVHPAGVTLIDFDTASLTDPALDVGKFLADLDWWFVQYGREDVQAAQEQFLDGYLRGAPKERLGRARLYEALILMKIAIRRVPIFSKDWAARTAALIEMADRLAG